MHRQLTGKDHHTARLPESLLSSGFYPRPWQSAPHRHFRRSSPLHRYLFSPSFYRRRQILPRLLPVWTLMPARRYWSKSPYQRQGHSHLHRWQGLGLIRRIRYHMPSHPRRQSTVSVSPENPPASEFPTVFESAVTSVLPVPIPPPVHLTALPPLLIPVPVSYAPLLPPQCRLLDYHALQASVSKLLIFRFRRLHCRHFPRRFHNP